MITGLIIVSAFYSCENTYCPSYQFILVRHAEKDTISVNPGLTSEGMDRAFRLANIFSQESVTAMYATPYRRTQETLQPLSKQKNLSILSYQPGDQKFLETLFKEHPNGGLFVIAGHSNTIPQLVNQLIEQDLLQNLDEKDYDDIFIVSTQGNTSPSILHLTY